MANQEQYEAAEASLPRQLPADGPYREALFWAAPYVDLDHPEAASALFKMIDRCFFVSRDQFLSDVENVQRFIRLLK